MKRLGYFLSAFLAEGFLAFFRLSFLWGVMGWLLATSSVGQYFTSTMHAHDLQRSARWSGEKLRQAQPVVILIDDTGYDRFFGGQSPLARDRMADLLATIAGNTPAQTRVVLDIDLSPVPAQAAAQQRLEALLLEQPGRWVLPAPKPTDANAAQALQGWREGLCKKGIGFGLPYVPTEFGYPLPTHQYSGGLADAATQVTLPCADPTVEFTQVPMPLQGAMLEGGVVIPFTGDLEQLGQMLQGLAPELVFVGGGWGHLDLFGTPFGERYGVQIHAAAAAAARAGERMVSPVQEMLVIWFFCGVIGALRGLLHNAVDQTRMRDLAHLPGHAFWRDTGRPLVFFTWVFFLVIGFSELLAMVHGATGYWVSTGNVAVFTLCSVLMSWGAGRTAPQFHSGFRHAWRELVLVPIAADWRSVRAAAVAMLGAAPMHVDFPADLTAPSRWELMREGLFSLARLGAETVLPLMSLYYALKEFA
ncbi:CHASE2 domain-containing protein [Curvibacter sp. APW13]|uniref:CHASE2 domain-containing protein n=1 Tax=Curvibacter sp. APW13 TaxID=3077236 RepID=UPI0028DFAC10|nr:CHASE2 domain-containing protein [Curvibacter sp. APW13]MDT8991519.1 CHASE2 domain-containing protein [Curvibacter sp. APW13]